jgi:hypothetical protein
MNYSKKILNPLITKLNINTDEDNTFKELISLTYDSPNYQLWAVNAVYSKYCTVGEIKSILAWAKSHKQLICQLSKHTITAYTSRYAITILKKEIKNIQLIDDVKTFINKFNTIQRNLLKEYLNLDSYSILNISKEKELKKWYKIFTKLQKLPDDQLDNFISTCSALHDITALLDAFTWCMDLSYKWNKKDFIGFVTKSTPNSPIVYNNENIVILHVTSHKDCNKLVGSEGRTKWCFNCNKTCWESYVNDTNSKQYFLFDFSKKESEETSHIAFTINKELGLTEAYTTHNLNIIEHGNDYVNEVFNEKGINISDFIKLNHPIDYKWEENSIKTILGENENVQVIDNSNNRLLISSENDKVSQRLIQHTILYKRLIKGTLQRKLYFLYDLNLKEDDPNGLICIKTTLSSNSKEEFLMAYNQCYLKVDKEYLKEIHVEI